MSIKTSKDKTLILIAENVAKVKQVYANSKITRWYDKYRCNQCGVEVLLRKDIRANKKYCSCQNQVRGNERLYFIWRNMIERCDIETHPAFNNYGGRGIKILDLSWYDFKKFKSWALNSGYSSDLTIERIDVNDGYYPENCTWATKKEQGRNKRNTKLSKKDIELIKNLYDDGFTRKEIFKIFKEKCGISHKTYIDTILRSERWA